MPAKYYRIFGFDQTITKKAIPPELIQLDSDHTLAIATYHNNPDYIAGFLQTLLDKKITFRATAQQTKKRNDLDLVGVHVYDIEGHEYPLLIAHIPQIDQKYFSAMTVLNAARGKNQHIELLRTCALEYNCIEENTYCDFFDDTELNVRLAENFKENHRLNSHLVIKTNPQFTVSNPDALQASLARGNASSSTFILNDPMLVSGIAGLLVAIGVLLAFALVAPPLTAVAVLTAAGCGLFAAAATYYTSTPTNASGSDLTI
jgi:hypothetical protein